MRIALLTIWHERNYGAEMQAYATVKFLTSMGHEVKMIDIRLSDRNKRNLKNRIVDLIESFGPCNRKFERFWRQNIPTTRRYKSIEEIQQNPPDADIYLVGSDQVWNPQITGRFQNLYFLNFGNPSVKRISYASSFGQNEVSYTDEEQIKYLLNRFSGISCRESSGVDLLQSKFKINAQQVLDPCFLNNSYSEFISDTSCNGTLCYYPLSNDLELESYSLRLARTLGLKPINMNRSVKLLKKIVWDRPSIEDWLNNIAHSNFVITRSFHGIVISLILRKQFAVLTSRNQRTTRLESLLKLIGLEERLYMSIDDLNYGKPWNNLIDYNVVTKKINDLRADSIKLFNEMINK